MDITKLIKYATTDIVTPELKGLKGSKFSDLWACKELWMHSLECKFTMKNGKLYSADKTYVSGWNVASLLNIYNRGETPTVYYYENTVGGIKKEYLRSLHSSNCFISKIHTDDIADTDLGVINKFSSWHKVLNLGAVPRNLHPYRINDMKYVLDILTKDWIDLDALVVPQSFLDSRKQQKAVKKSKNCLLYTSPSPRDS